jgi:hypothetical protein
MINGQESVLFPKRDKSMVLTAELLWLAYMSELLP